MLLAGSLLCCQCAKAPEVAPTPKPDYDQKSIEIMQAVSPAVVGDWTLRRVHITAQWHNEGQHELGIERDTVLQDFATLSVQAAPSGHSPADPRYPYFTGFLRYHTKTYLVHFDLIARPQRVVEGKGPQAFFLFNTNFPVGSRPFDPEEQLLRHLGLIGENFTLEVVPGQPRTMTWRGLSHGLSKIELEK
jgi:hypothetical protein